MFLPGWFPAGASRIIPAFNLVEADVDSGDASTYGRTFSIPNVRPDRYIVVLSSTGKNSGTTTIVNETLGGIAPSGVSQANSRTAVSIAYRHVPAGTTIEYIWTLNSTQTAWAFACFEVWGLHPSVLVQSRQGAGNIDVRANGLLFAATAGGDPGLTLNNMTQLSHSDGSEVGRDTAYKVDFPSDQTFNVATTGAPASLVALSLR
jgi:hypothetical protein